MDYKEFYKQFGLQNPNYYFRRVVRDKSGEDPYRAASKNLERIFKDPSKYSQQEIRDAYGKVLFRPGSRESRELNEDQYYDRTGGEDDDSIFNEDRFKTAQNRYDIGLQDLLLRARPTAPAPAPAPAPVAPKPVLPTISEEAKQYRADTMKILQQADERMKAFEVQRGQDEAARAAQRAQDEAARVERERIAAQSAAARSANMMRAGQAPNLQIQPASQTPTTGGTQPFKRRRMMIGGVSPYLGLSIGS